MLSFDERVVVHHVDSRARTPTAEQGGLGPYDSPRGGAVSCERGTPVGLRVSCLGLRGLWDQIAFLNYLDLHHKSPDSGERQYKSRTRERRFGVPVEEEEAHEKEGIVVPPAVERIRHK